MASWGARNGAPVCHRLWVCALELRVCLFSALLAGVTLKHGLSRSQTGAPVSDLGTAYLKLQISGFETGAGSVVPPGLGAHCGGPHPALKWPDYYQSPLRGSAGPCDRSAGVSPALGVHT